MQRMEKAFPQIPENMRAENKQKGRNGTGVKEI